jgi:hypothetical protein
MASAQGQTKPASGKRKRNKQLMSKVIKQLEFYFSDTNLHKDRFMKELVLGSDSVTGKAVEISTLMKFNKLKSMGATPEVQTQTVPAVGRELKDSLHSTPLP